MIHEFTVGRLSCAVVSDGQMEPPWEPPLETFFAPDSGVPANHLQAAVAAEGENRSTLACGYNCLLVRTADGDAVIDTGLGARFLGYGPRIEPLVGRLGAGLASAGAAPAGLNAVIFTHLHQDHCRGATWSGELTFPSATGFAHAAEVAFWSGPVLTSTAGAAHEEHVRVRARGDQAARQPAAQVRAQRRAPARHPHRRRGRPQHVLIHAYHMPFPGLGTVTRRGDAYAWTPLA